MTTITRNAPATSTTSLWKPATVAGLGAAAATAAIAVVAHTAGVSLEVGGEPIPPSGFATMTLLAVVLGFGLAVALRRWAGNPRQTFVRATIALTALSFVPDLLVSASSATRLTLMATHVVAAAIVIPAIARRLARD
ncbi:MAG: hypothetical protein QOJ72_917 [Nocardioidaceae bacterium]|nr:hypothetical protein [Nocardioidaceae bacterium]